MRAPLVLGVSATGAVRFDEDAPVALAHLGQNTGNILFSDAVLGALNGATRAGYFFTQSDLEGRDCIVIAAANWMNAFDDFGFIAEACERTDLPVVIVGIGAQPDSKNDYPMLRPGTERLLRIAAERSRLISVRGDYSADMLSAIGITNVSVTGCPSLLLAGRQVAPIRRPTHINPATTVIHATRHLFGSPDLLQRFLYRQAKHFGCDLLLQSELSDIIIGAKAPTDPETLEMAYRTARETFGTEDDRDLATYLTDHARAFSDLPAWLAYNRTKQFEIGTRFHGTIAALLAGTPALLITHDVRTEELARVMTIPSIRGDAIDRSHELRLESLYDGGAIDAFEAGYVRYREQFSAFFARNGLRVTNDLRPAAPASSGSMRQPGN